MTWQGVLAAVDARFASADAHRFARLHRAFIAYPAQHTCRSFYDFVAEHGLHDLLACYRFQRLVRIAESLQGAALHGATILDFGAGGGFLGGYLRDALDAKVFVADLSPVSLKTLASKGFTIFDPASAAPPPRFDLILCADSLGEVHADEDGWLSDPANASAPALPDEVEARYGIAEKLAPLKSFIASNGIVSVHEPVQTETFWKGAANLLERHQWKPSLHGPEGGRHLRLRRAD